MNVLLLKYNKTTNESFHRLVSSSPDLFVLDDFDFGLKIDHVDYSTLSKYLKQYLNKINAVFVGDIFWDTGQNICSWSGSHNIVSCFLQHGQWIYTANKQNPTYTPNFIFVFGDNMVEDTKNWPLARKSKIISVGSPRYDDSLNGIVNKGYVYFAPPVISEILHSGKCKYNKTSLSWLSELRGIDGMCQLYIHPHYREGSIDQLKNLFPAATFIPPSDSPLLWVKECDRVITHRNSTTVLDAIAHKKRVILMNFEDYNNHSYYPNGYFNDFAIETNEPNACIRLAGIKFTNIDENNEDYINRSKPYIYLGNASERILEHCRSF